jgi:ssDNA-specific exonuclease RecJ
MQVQNMNLKLNMNDISKILAQAHFKYIFFSNDVKKNTFLQKHVSIKLLEVSLSCLHFSLMFSEGEVKSPCFLQVWWALSGKYHISQVKLILLR